MFVFFVVGGAVNVLAFFCFCVCFFGLFAHSVFLSVFCVHSLHVPCVCGSSSSNTRLQVLHFHLPHPHPSSESLYFEPHRSHLCQEPLVI